MNEIRFDGSFEYNGQEVYYRINDELRDIKYKHGEPVKAQRFIHFFEVLGKAIDSYPYYASYEQVTNISQWDVAKIFKKMKDGKVD